MKMNEYIEKARSTAMYPDLGSNMYYPTLGLAGECAEVYDKLHFGSESFEVVKELGDVMWYVANLMTELEIPFEDVNVESVSGDAMSLCGLMVIAAGSICEDVKKTMRDSDGIMTEAKRTSVTCAIGMIHSYIDAIAGSMDSDIDIVAQTNIDKLFSRKERGVLTGDGDNR